MATNIIKAAREIGLSQASGRGVLARLALEAVKAAEDGEIDASDAARVYEEYAKAARGVTKFDASEMAARVQISKLRQIVKLGEEFPGARKLLDRVTAMHEKVTREHKAAPLYEVFINVARRQAQHKDPLSDRVILGFMKK